MERLTLHEAIRGSTGGVDRTGVMFAHGGHLYRAFRTEAAEVIDRLLRDPGLEELFEAGLVRFWRADIEVESFDLVVEAERVSRVSFPTEWPTEMLRTAAVTIARLCERLAARGIGIKDPHPWNVLFEGSRAVFIDLGSLNNDPTPTLGWRREFRRHLLVPLTLHDRGLHRLADLVAQEHPTGPLKSLLERRTARALLFRKTERLASRTSAAAEFYGGLAELCAALDASGTPMAWSSYDQQATTIGNVAAYTDKQKSVHELLTGMEPTTLLDLACNQGWYSELAARAGFQVAATDIDDAALGILYRRSAAEELDILPLRLDVVWPRGSYGLGLAYPEPYHRIRSDVVLALALLHHLVREHDLTFVAFAQIIDRVAEKAAIVEFIPRDDLHVARWSLGEWYTEEAFLEAMSAYFPRATRVASAPMPRVLYLFER